LSEIAFLLWWSNPLHSARQLSSEVMHLDLHLAACHWRLKMLNSGGIKLTSCQSLRSKLRGCVDAGHGRIEHQRDRQQNSEVPPTPQKRSKRASKLDGYKGYIIIRLHDYPLSAKRIYREIQEILHHCTTINIKGDSYRLKDRKRQGLIPQSFPG